MSTRIDNERLAALLDGRLTSAERAEILAQLAESDADTLAAIADAAALINEREPLSIGNRRKSTGLLASMRRFRLDLGVAAAGIIVTLGLGLVGRSWFAQGSSHDAKQRAAAPVTLDYTTDFAGLLSVFTASPSQTASTRARAVPLRGVATTSLREGRVVEPDTGRAAGQQVARPPAQSVAQGFSDEKANEIVDSAETISLRMGSLLTDLRLSARGLGSREASASELAVLLRGAGQESASALFDTISRASPGSTEASDSAITHAVRSIQPIGRWGDAITLGAWLEAARVAAGTNDAVFFNRTWAVIGLMSVLSSRDSSRLADQARRLRADASKALDPLMSETPRRSVKAPFTLRP